MKYFIYALVAVLVLWSLWVLYRHVRRFLRGECRMDCKNCGNSEHCGHRKYRRR